MKRYFASTAAFVLLAVSLSGCIWYPHGGYGGGYGHGYYGGGGGGGGGWHHP
jgi:hypothetical protein